MHDLSDIVGQPNAIDRLCRAMTGERMPHAFIFAGPVGVGRRTTALALAKTLLCANVRAQGGIVRPCGTCDDCRMMDALTHPDFHLVYKELAAYHEDSNVRSRVMQELGIEVIKSFLIAPAYRGATRGRGKVFVIREAELMSQAAQNSLLKTLEEPPPGVTIVLLCESPDQLLPTTLSRCSLIRFGPLPRQFVADQLAARQVDQTEAQFWAGFADGSIGQALRLHEQGMYEIKRRVLDGLASLSPAGDGELADYLRETAEQLAGVSVKASRKADGAEMSKALATRQATSAMLEIIASTYRDALRLSVGNPRSDTRLIHADQIDAIAALAARLDATTIAEIVEQLSSYEQLLWRNVNPKVVWDNVVISCASGAPLDL